MAETASPCSLSSPLIEIITSNDPDVRNQCLASACSNYSNTTQLLEECDRLEAFRKASDNLYQRVRACFFLYAIHRFHLSHPDQDETTWTQETTAHSPPGNISTPTIPYSGYQCLQTRQFAEAIEHFLQCNNSPGRSSALARAYYQLAFQTLADQVRASVRQHPGNAWMYDVLDPAQHPYTLRRLDDLPSHILHEQTPVRMDLSHAGWSDIFFLGMDFPEGARVLNVSIDLAVHTTNPDRNNAALEPVPPIDCYLQVLPDEPVLRLTSIDLQCQVTLTHISQVFEFGQDYLGLLKAGVIASGLVPVGLEHSSAPLAELFQRLFQHDQPKGLHLVTRVNDIPKGSRLAVSTNLLSSIIAVCMRATGQTTTVEGVLTEEERRLVAARAILGEWLGGSGGGWQDSGGVWPGIKLIQGVLANHPDYPEYGVSRGRLLPQHHVLNEELPPELVKALQDHLVLVHGGLAQNVGPILEMVTEKYLLRSMDEWKARHEALAILEQILDALKETDIPKLAQLTTRNFFGPIQTIIPWASNQFTELLIERTRKHFGDDFLGFWMLGGASGGGMGFMFRPHAKNRALVELQGLMLTTKRELEHALPFAMDPVIYDFRINNDGTIAQWCLDGELPTLISEPVSDVEDSNTYQQSLDGLLEELGFDVSDHVKVQEDYRQGKIGLEQNRLSLDIQVENVLPEDVVFAEQAIDSELVAKGMEELKNGTVGVVSLAAGVGSRWTQGAGCVKAIHPFCKMAGRYRSFLEVHLAKSRQKSQLAGMPLPHVVTSSFMTDDAIKAYLARVENHGYQGPLYVSQEKSMGLRLVPTARDLSFSWKQLPQLDEQAQKVRDSAQKGLLAWVKSCGEASDYRDNVPLQCLHPVGHFYSIPNLLLNGTLRKMLEDRPQLKTLLLHNIDTVGADCDPGMLGLFLSNNSTFSFEVIPRRIEDVGGGLAKVDGRTRLIEGLALPREEDEFKFTYYNSMTTWIDIDSLLTVFGLSRPDLKDQAKVADAIHSFTSRIPTYVALKQVKKRWGNGQEDVFPTAQFEKLWSDMSSLDDVKCQFVVVSRYRGMQLKDVSQLDGWLRDGSASYAEKLCSFQDEAFHPKR